MLGREPGQCRCDSKRFVLDPENVEVYCGDCGIVSDQENELYGGHESTNHKYGQYEESQRQHEIGLGTDISKNISNNIKKWWHHHFAKPPKNKYNTYALGCLSNALKYERQFENLRRVLEEEIVRAVNNYVKVKKDAREKIPCKKIRQKVGKDMRNTITYPGIDHIIRNTIIVFCAKNRGFGNNIMSDLIMLHKTIRHTRHGNRKGNKRPGGYSDQFEGLNLKICSKHGKFKEKSHWQHWANIHFDKEKETRTYQWYLKQYVKGYAENQAKKRKQAKLMQTKKVCRISTIAKTCAYCGNRLKEYKNYSVKKLKNGEKKTYMYLKEWHIIEIDGKKIRIKECPVKKKAWQVRTRPAGIQ